MPFIAINITRDASLSFCVKVIISLARDELEFALDLFRRSVAEYKSWRHCAVIDSATTDSPENCVLRAAVCYDLSDSII
jgi:hypothetical protein